MSAREVTCFIAQCDGCETEYEHDYTPHWPSAVEAIDDVVNNADWWASPDRKTLLCDDCKTNPHAHVPDSFSPEDCDRCGNPADEHDSEVPS